MTLFKSAVHQDVWIEHNCHTCFQPDEAARRLHNQATACPIQRRALRTQRKPVQWDRTRSKDMATSIRCNAYQDRPESTARRLVKDGMHQQFLLFDVTPTGTEVDHA